MSSQPWYNRESKFTRGVSFDAKVEFPKPYYPINPGVILPENKAAFSVCILIPSGTDWPKSKTN